MFNKPKKTKSESEILLSQLISMADNSIKEKTLSNLLATNGIKASVSTYNENKARVIIGNQTKIISYKEVFFKPNNVIKYFKRKF